MNSDTTYDQIDSAHYTFGKNLRITKNQLVGVTSSDNYSSLHEGIVTPVLDGQTIKSVSGFNHNRILAVDTVDNLGTIVVANNNTNTGITVYRFVLDEVTNNVSECIPIWKDDTVEFSAGNLSTILYKELENVIKLYIATGKLPIITLRVDNTDDAKYSLGTYPYSTPADYLINNRMVPQNRVYISDIISGRLKTSQVQYTYRYYNKHANTTALAPLTNKIQVIDPSRVREHGNAEDTETALGFTLDIDTTTFKNYFKRIQVYRLSYIKPGEDAEVSLIYDGKIRDDSGNNKFILNDVGIEPLQTLTIEEFAAMQGLLLIPQTMAYNQNYMFCGNVTDDTIMKGLSIQSNPTISNVEAKVVIADQSDGQIPYVTKKSFSEADCAYIVDYGTQANLTTVSNYIKQRGINPELAKCTYNNIVTSSLLRSLRRGEKYRYGIIFYDKYGRRSDIINLGDTTPVNIDISSPKSMPFQNDYVFGRDPYADGYVHTGRVIAQPLGVKIPVPQPVGDGSNGIVGCQIVRRSSKDVYQNTILQVALARPLSQGLAETEGSSETTKYSPFYPSGFLAVNDMIIKPHYYHNLGYDNIPDLNAQTRNFELFQAFSSEINFRRDDVLSRINVSDTKLIEQYYIRSKFLKYSGTSSTEQFDGLSYQTQWLGSEEALHATGRYILFDKGLVERLNISKKQDYYWVFNFFGKNDLIGNDFRRSNFTSEATIKNIKDVKMAEWKDGFTNVTNEADNTNIYDAIKKYKSYTTAIDKFTYNNWASFAKYDLKPGLNRQPNNDDRDGRVHQELIGTVNIFEAWYGQFDNYIDELSHNVNDLQRMTRAGYIGPGPSCFILTTEQSTGTFPTPLDGFWTSICNITHAAKTDAVESDENTQYFGFGNYFPLKKDSYDGKYKVKLSDGSLQDYMIVFDGDIYITPHEFTTMYKCYNFESVDSVQSTQVTNYVPLESKVNTYFDYGMNMVNTASPNLLWEPGEIDGVTSQERPAHQYNMIYSDNDASNDVYTLISTDKDDTNDFKQRAYYSEPKTNGEFIDNFLIFKTVAFIDVDSSYGQITNLFSDKNSLFYWQDHAFGKFSVNERSLINDQNGNTIMLGQAGILSRFDYISTKFGMRLYDFCARSAEQGIYWVDINNKAVVAANSGQAINFGEQVGVQNIINDKISTAIPKVDYDLQNNELLCKFLNNEEQLIFNVKYNFATSIYSRKYSNIAYIKNHIYGLRPGSTLYFDKHNYLSTDTAKYLTPLILEYVVNPSASVTKVFDNQQFVPIKRDKFANASQIFNKVKMAFETDIVNKTLADIDPYNDREGNITYVVPRYDNGDGFGNRIRGKWMKVNITRDNPIEYFTVSHIITKFRQSFS